VGHHSGLRGKPRVTLCEVLSHKWSVFSGQLRVWSDESRTSPSWRERSDRRIWWCGATIHRLLRMLRHSQARSSSMDLCASPSWREHSDRRIWWCGATIHRLLRMLRHSQARSSSTDLRPSPSWRECSDRRIWQCGASYYSPPPPNASSLAGSFLQHGFMIKSILEGAQRPKDLVAGSNHPPPHRMLRYSQARSSSTDLRLF